MAGISKSALETYLVATLDSHSAIVDVTPLHLSNGEIYIMVVDNNNTVYKLRVSVIHGADESPKEKWSRCQ